MKSPIGNDIHVNTAACDYWTVTSWDYNHMALVLSELGCELIEGGHLRRGDHKVQQYVGLRHTAYNGHMFAGEGEQSGMLHYRIEVSGSLAHDTLDYLQRLVLDGAKCTRIDIQATMQQPEGWSQFNMFKAAYDRSQDGRQRAPKAGWRDSDDRELGQLATVYLGSMASLRFMRVYQKPLSINGNRSIWLRAEVQFKKEQAQNVALSIANGTRHLGDCLLASIQMTRCPELSVYESLLGGYNPTLPKTVKPRGKTASWLLAQVLPTFTRVINTHDSGDSVAVLDAFKAAIKRHEDWQ